MQSCSYSDRSGTEVKSNYSYSKNWEKTKDGYLQSTRRFACRVRHTNRHSQETVKRYRVIEGGAARRTSEYTGAAACTHAAIHHLKKATAARKEGSFDVHVSGSLRETAAQTAAVAVNGTTYRQAKALRNPPYP